MTDRQRPSFPTNNFGTKEKQVIPNAEKGWKERFNGYRNLLKGEEMKALNK